MQSENFSTRWIRIWCWNLCPGWIFTGTLHFQNFDFHEHATSDFPFEISRPTEKIRSWKFDRTLLFYLEKVEDYDTEGIELMKISDLNDFGRHCYPPSGRVTFHILARMRRVLRTIFFDLWRCAHAYGSHEHRWVRSTLRTQIFFLPNFFPEFSGFQIFSEFCWQFRENRNFQITIRFSLFQWLIFTVECAESESELRIHVRIRFPMEQLIRTISGCMCNDFFWKCNFF